MGQGFALLPHVRIKDRRACKKYGTWGTLPYNRESRPGILMEDRTRVL